MFWVLILALQILVFNHLNAGPYINPYIYPVLIVLLPFDIAGWALLFIAAALGLSIDLFTGTLGIHLFASVLMAAVRPYFTKTLALGKFEVDGSLNIKQHGLLISFTFLFLLFFVHHFSYFLLESFSLSNFLPAILRSFLSTLVSILISFILLLFFYNSRKHER